MPMTGRNEEDITTDTAKAPISIGEANEAIRKSIREREAARLLALCLDDSDDESEEIIRAERDRKRTDLVMDHMLRRRNWLGQLLWQQKRASDCEPMRRRTVYQKEIRRQTKKYIRTSEIRASFDIAKYGGFGESSAESTLSKSRQRLDPKMTWIVDFKLLPFLETNNIHKALGYDHDEFRQWWKKKYVSPESDEWSDLRKLTRKVVFFLEKIYSAKDQLSEVVKRLFMTGETAREIMYLLLLLSSTFPEKWREVQDIFEYVAPVFYIISCVVNASIEVSARGSIGKIEKGKIDRQLNLIESCTRELSSRCYKLGFELGFDSDAYQQTPFDLSIGTEVNETTKSVVLENCLTSTTERRTQMLKKINSQLKLKHSFSSATTYSRTSTDILDVKELEYLGLKPIDISCSPSKFKGSGGYAEVFAMKIAGSSNVVAVKCFFDDEGTHRRIKREALTWVNLSQRNILPLLGFASLPSNPQPCLVSRLCWGNLKEYVEHKPLAMKRKLQLIRDITYGLDYLHIRDIAHGDLRAVNVLVTEDSDNELVSYAMLNDFGMSDDTSPDQHRTLNLTSVNQRTNDCWIAPELMQRAAENGIKSRVSKAGDVYALGVVFLEVIFEKQPYEDDQPFVQAAKVKGELPAKRDQLETNDSYWNFMSKCWETVEKRWTLPSAGANVLIMLNASDN